MTGPAVPLSPVSTLTLNEFNFGMIQSPLRGEERFRADVRFAHEPLKTVILVIASYKAA